MTSIPENSFDETSVSDERDNKAAWGAVAGLSLGAFILVSSEFMPVSLLTPIAHDLSVTEGQAGQTIAVSGVFAVLTSLSLASLTRRLDRKFVLLALIALMIGAGIAAGLAQTFLMLLIGRALIGVAIGGFWSLSAAVAMRLVPDRKVPTALAVVNGGNALATVIAAPIGSLLGGLFGWRAAFFCLIPIAAVALLWLTWSLPKLAPNDGEGRKNVLSVLASLPVSFGMIATALFFMGQFTLFTYLRPFLEVVTGVDVSTLTMMLLLLGSAGFAGTVLINRPIERALYSTLSAIPILLAAIAIGFIFFGSSTLGACVLMISWGALATSAPVAYWTWIAKTLPADAEVGGGLMVAVVQIAITCGASLGGMLYDFGGYLNTFIASAMLLLASGVMAVVTAMISRRATE